MKTNFQLPPKQIIYLLKIRLIQFYYRLMKLDLYLYDSSKLSPEINGLDPLLVYRSTPADPFTLRRFLKKLIDSKLISTDNIIDIGCGKGAGIFMFKRMNFKKISGIELNNKVADIAENNFKNNSAIRIYCQNALEFGEYSSYSNFYLYNPFPRNVFEKWIKIVLEARRGRVINIIYANDFCSDILFQLGFIKLADDIDIWGCSFGYYTLNS